MDPLAVAATKTVAGKAAAALEKESEGFIKAALREPAKALGSLLSIPINERIHRNLIQVTVRANRLLAEAGVSPQEVPLNIIHPALQAASLEENPDLQEVWANLLANATDPRKANPVWPSFPAILKELTAREAKFLDALWADVGQGAERLGADGRAHPISEKIYDRQQLMNIFSIAKLTRHHLHGSMSVNHYREHKIEIDADEYDLTVTIDILTRSGVLKEQPFATPQLYPHSYPQTVEIKQKYSFTELGVAFVTTCQAPKAK